MNRFLLRALALGAWVLIAICPVSPQQGNQTKDCRSLKMMT